MSPEEHEERRREWRTSGISRVLIIILFALSFWWLNQHPDWFAALFHRFPDGSPRPY